MNINIILYTISVRFNIVNMVTIENDEEIIQRGYNVIIENPAWVEYVKSFNRGKGLCGPMMLFFLILKMRFIWIIHRIAQYHYRLLLINVKLY